MRDSRESRRAGPSALRWSAESGAGDAGIASGATVTAMNAGARLVRPAPAAVIRNMRNDLQDALELGS
jgi:hypothetical protein